MNEQRIEVVVTKREDHTPDIAVIEIASSIGSPLPAFEAGAHIDVHVSDDIVRQYSLSNAPGRSNTYRLGVLKDSDSRGGSSAIHATFKKGHELAISAPRNHFPLNMKAGRTVLVGGGIGITPMLAMAHALKAANKTFELHYCCRNRASAGFLCELEEEFGPQFKLYADDESGERFDLSRVMTTPLEQLHLYVCGPSGFMDWVIGNASRLGLPSSNIHFEYFNAQVDNTGSAFEVEAALSGVTVQVADGISIAEALKQAGVKVDVSCEQGICGTCICDVLEGVPDHKDHFLNDEEREMNDQMAVCCSRSRTGRIVLDI